MCIYGVYAQHIHNAIYILYIYLYILVHIQFLASSASFVSSIFPYRSIGPFVCDEECTRYWQGMQRNEKTNSLCCINMREEK